MNLMGAIILSPEMWRYWRDDMDREVLFRGKRMDNGEWVEGWYCPKKTGHYEGDRFVEEMQSVIIASMTGGGYQYAVVDPKTVCQYTGLADRNGRKIFEGDISAIPYSKKQGLPAEVRYNVRSGAYEIRRNGYRPISLADADEWCEVVGNAFDNPELLEGGAE